MAPHTSDEPTPTPRAETSAVQLTRIEGKLDLISFRINALDTLVGSHDKQIAQLVLSVQSITDQAIARDATVEATAKALKAATDERIIQAELKWKPAYRFYATIGAIAAATGVATFIAQFNF